MSKAGERVPVSPSPPASPEAPSQSLPSSWQQAGDTEPVPVQTPLPREQRSDRGPSKVGGQSRGQEDPVFVNDP